MKNVRNIGCPSPFFILRSQFSVDALVNPRNLNLMLMGVSIFIPSPISTLFATFFSYGRWFNPPDNKHMKSAPSVSVFRNLIERGVREMARSWEMKRGLSLLVMFVGMMLLAGCGVGGSEDLVAATLDSLSAATSEITNIQLRVNEAVKKSNNQKGLDLDDALKAVEQLKKVTEEAKVLRVKIDRQKETVTEEQRKKNTTEQVRNRIETEYGQLFDESEKLRAAMAKAAEVDPAATDNLKKKLNEALAVFELLAR